MSYVDAFRSISCTDAFTRRTIKTAVKYLHDAQRPEGGWFGFMGHLLHVRNTIRSGESGVGRRDIRNERAACVRHVISCSASSARTEGGAKASRFVVYFGVRMNLLSNVYFKACADVAWVEHKETQVVMTSWATMALMYAQYPEPEPIERAMKMVMSRQQPVRVHTILSQGLRFIFAFFLSLPPGWLMEAGGDRGYVQPDVRHRISELQVLLYNMDAGEGAQIPGELTDVETEWHRCEWAHEWGCKTLSVGDIGLVAGA